jgi:hypothetical protein
VVINPYNSLAKVEVNTLCNYVKDSNEAIFIEIRGNIAINDGDVVLFWLRSDTFEIQVVLNEARQIIYYLNDSKENPNAIGYELNSAPTRPSTIIYATLLFYRTQIQKVDAIALDSYVHEDSRERKNQIIARNLLRSDRCINEIMLGTQTELLNDLSVSVGVEKNNKATSIELILVIRSATLVLLLWLYLLLRKDYSKDLNE